VGKGILTIDCRLDVIWTPMGAHVLLAYSVREFPGSRNTFRKTECLHLFLVIV
jgi:hypothetical protein